MRGLIYTTLISLYFGCINAQIEVIPMDILNSQFVEHFPTLNPTGDCICFTTHRGGREWSRTTPINGQYDGDIYCAWKKNGNFQPPVPMPSSINSSSQEDECSITIDGEIVYWESWSPNWKTEGGPYYYAILSENNWNSPIGLGGGMTDFIKDQIGLSRARMFKEVEKVFPKEMAEQIIELYPTHPKEAKSRMDIMDFDYDKFDMFTQGMTVSPDEKTIILSAMKYDDINMHFDLFISYKVEGEWSYPVPLHELNTKSNEVTPSIIGDFSTLFFASDRKGGEGGFDMYKYDLSNSTEGVINIGKPYNSVHNEKGLVLSSLELEGEGYLIRNGNIYKVQPNKTIASNKTILIQGFVGNYKNQPIESSVFLVSSKIEMIETQTNSTNGSYTFVQKYQGADTLNVFIEPPAGSTGRDVVETVIISEETEFPVIVNFEIEYHAPVGDTISSENLRFDATKSNLLIENESILNAIIKKVKNTNNMVLIVGHTNSYPTEKESYSLSLKRAKKVYDYFRIQGGIPTKRLEYTGKGKEEPARSNKTSSGRKMNQRVEIFILSPL